MQYTYQKRELQTCFEQERLHRKRDKFGTTIVINRRIFSDYAWCSLLLELLICNFLRYPKINFESERKLAIYIDDLSHPWSPITGLEEKAANVHCISMNTTQTLRTCFNGANELNTELYSKIATGRVSPWVVGYAFISSCSILIQYRTA